MKEEGTLGVFISQACSLMSHSELAASSHQPQVLAPAGALSTHLFLLPFSPPAPGTSLSLVVSLYSAHTFINNPLLNSSQMTQFEQAICVGFFSGLHLITEGNQQQQEE